MVAAVIAVGLIAPAQVADAAAGPNAATIANHLLQVLNGERADNRVPALVRSGPLNTSAHRHDLLMAGRNTMSHQLPGEAGLVSRFRSAGYSPRVAGENIAWTTNMTDAGAVALQTYMYNERPPNNGHRVNILSSGYRDVGIDVVLDTRHHKLWITFDFGRR